MPFPHIPDYELIRLVGSGSYGEVWLGRSILGAYRAVKVIHRERFEDDRPYEREFQGIRNFEPISRGHESQVDVLHIGRNEAQGFFYYVMELADDAVAGAAGGAMSPPPSADGLIPARYTPRTLRLDLERRGHLPVAECIELGLALATALDHLHGYGLIHRDIKPSNIIFVQGRPKLADIGLVTEMDRTMSFVGTAGYFPPEGPGTVQGDIYSLGKVLYEASTGKDRTAFPELPTALRDRTEDEALLELNEVIVRACHQDPRCRYASARALFDDLGFLKQGKSIRWSRVVERRLVHTKRVLAVVCLLAVLAIGGYLLQRHQTFAVQRSLYAANLNLAQRDWDKANLGRIENLLAATQADPDKGFEWFFWQRQLRHDQLTLQGHTGAVISVAFAPRGGKLVTGGEDGTVRLWESESGRPSIVLESHRGRISSVEFSPDGERVLTASYDGSVTVWSASTGQRILALPMAPTGLPFGAAYAPNGRQIAVSMRYLRGRSGFGIELWGEASGERLRVLHEEPAGPGSSQVVFSQDGRWIAAITKPSTLRVWEAASGRTALVHTLEHDCYALALSPDGRHLLTGGAGETAVWSVATGEQVFSLQGGHQHHVFSLAYAPDGRSFVTAGADQRVIVWDAASGKERFRLLGHRASVRAVKFSADGKRIATVSEDGRIKLWDAAGPPNPRTFRVHTSSTHPLAHVINMLVYSPDGLLLATTVADCTVRLWDVATGREIRVLDGFVEQVHSIAFSPDGRRIATGNGVVATRGGQEAVKVWDCATGRLSLVLRGNGFVAFAPNGRLIATSSGNSRAILWDAMTGEARITLEGHTQWVNIGAFSPDGQQIATSSRDRTVKIWDTATGRLRLTIKPEGTGQTPSSLMFSPDGKRLLIGGSLTPRVYDAVNGRALLALEGHTSWINSAGFSPDGTRVVTASHDRTARIWDARAGRELLALDGYTRMVSSAVFSPDGRTVATADYDGQIRLWETTAPK